MTPDEIALVAQKISFAYEDYFFDEEKREQFHAFFEKYLAGIDPAGEMEPYDAVKVLGRKDPGQFELMVNELKESGLLPD